MNSTITDANKPDAQKTVISLQHWKDLFRDGYFSVNGGHNAHVENGRKFGEWLNGGEIRIFTYGAVNRETPARVRSGLEYMLRVFGIDELSIKFYGAHESIVPFVRSSINQGYLDSAKLISLLFQESYRDERIGGKQHADVVITDLLFMDDKFENITRACWGASEFRRGGMVLALPIVRQRAAGYIEHIARHETVHLLGYEMHCDTARNFNADVEDHPHDPECLMNWSVPSGNICEKDKEAVLSFWEGIRARGIDIRR